MCDNVARICGGVPRCFSECGGGGNVGGCGGGVGGSSGGGCGGNSCGCGRCVTRSDERLLNYINFLDHRDERKEKLRQPQPQQPIIVFEGEKGCGGGGGGGGGKGCCGTGCQVQWHDVDVNLKQVPRGYIRCDYLIVNYRIIV